MEKYTENPNAMEITAIIADMQPIVLDGFVFALERSGIKVLAKILLADQIIDEYTKCRPDVVILNIKFGDTNSGLLAGEKILSLNPSANLIFLSESDQPMLVTNAYGIGGRAFLTRDCTIDELLQAVKNAAQGEDYFLPKIAERSARERFRDIKSPVSTLDDVEISVFKLMARGLTNRQISEELSFTIRTAAMTTNSVREKLKLTNQADITRIAIKHGYLEP